MDIQIRILRTEAVIIIAQLVNYNPDQLEHHIINRMTAEDLLDPQEKMAAGKTVLDQAKLNGLSAQAINKLLFPDYVNREIWELLGGVYFYGTNENDPCNECGCEMELNDNDWDDERQSHIDIYKCTNEDCQHKDHRHGEEPECLTYVSAL